VCLATYRKTYVQSACESRDGLNNSLGTSVQVSAAQGVNLTRIFLFINGKDQLQASVQPQIGVFNETGLQRFDLIFAMCARYGMRGIMALANFEPWLGGYPWCTRCGLGMHLIHYKF
jgi:hypothetical protein